MRKLLLPCLFLFAFLGGCRCIPCETLPAMRAGMEAIGPDYVQYVQNDGSLSNEDKRHRIATVARYMDLLEELQNLCSGDVDED